MGPTESAVGEEEILYKLPLVMMVIEDEVELFSGILNNLTAFSCPNKF
jgi:hypothetical protein